MNPYEHKQISIMAQSCQKDAVAIVRTKYLYNKDIEGDIRTIITNDMIIEEVLKVRDKLLKVLIDNYVK